MALFHSQGVILKSQDYRERDRLITVFTPDRGKIRMIAQGARRPGSRFGSALELGSIIAFDAYQRGPDTLGRLNNGKVEMQLSRPRADVRAYAYLHVLLELVSALSYGSDAAPVFAELVSELGSVERATVNPATLLNFIPRLLAHIGHAPELMHCVACGAPARPGVGFSPELGGVACRDCHPSGLLLPDEAHRALLRETTGAQGIELALEILQRFIACQFDVELRSWPFFRQQWTGEKKRLAGNM